jgi:DNA-binding XRE family transcriptional regulator
MSDVKLREPDIKWGSVQMCVEYVCSSCGGLLKSEGLVYQKTVKNKILYYIAVHSCDKCRPLETLYKKWNGERIKIAIKECRYTQKRACELIGVSRQTLHKWINGKVPKGEYLIRLCVAFNVKASFFFNRLR